MRLTANEEKYHDKKVYKMISRNVKFYREHNRNPKFVRQKLTQIKLCEEADISRSLLSGIESEKFYIEFSISVINRISVVCHIPLPWFFMEEPPAEFYSNGKM